MRAASQQMHISEVFVEKDYWITLVLSHLAKSKYAAEAVFKGGTSLSALAYTVIPDEKKVARHFKELIKRIQ